MYSITLRLFGALLIAAALFIFPLLMGPSHAAAQAQGDVQEQIDELLKAYAAALDEELKNGTTQLFVDPALGPTKILSSETQAKMDLLWAETLEKINTLQARPEMERAPTEQLIRSVSGVDPSYLSRAGTAYDPSAELEEYVAGKYFFDVHIRSGEIVKVWLVDQRDYSVLGAASDDDLLSVAKDYIAKFSPSTSLGGLTLTIASKQGTVFYRWEDNARTLADGTRAFVQVGLSRAEDLLNFENTLPIASADATNFTLHGVLAGLMDVMPAFATGANEVYANGGTQWAWEIHLASHSSRTMQATATTRAGAAQSTSTSQTLQVAITPMAEPTIAGGGRRQRTCGIATPGHQRTSQVPMQLPTCFIANGTMAAPLRSRTA